MKKRILSIRTEKINDFVPIEDDQRANTLEFINLIQGMACSRKENQDDYARRIKTRQRLAASQLPSTPNLQIPSVSCQQSTSSTSRISAHDMRRIEARLHNPVVPLTVDSSTSDSNDSDDTNDSDSLFRSSTNRFNSSNLYLLQGYSDAYVQHKTTSTAASNITPTINNTLPPPSNTSNITDQPPHDPREIHTHIESNQNTNDNTPTLSPVPTISHIAALSHSRTTPTNTTTTTPKTPQPNTVTQLSQDVPIPPVRENLVNIARPRALPVLPSFLTYPGTGLCTSIMAVEKVDGFENTLIHGKRTDWFANKNPSFFADGGILCHYRFTAAL